ncbi:PAS domain S-box protein [Laspinema olomoucense]|uniref:PAS domain S-box protein n=1 Tax=Laspinema olomoucense TaxID=3231600 RepID=UPI0021BA89AB|nr:PAS domain S-box protein [Laspinema sp. D3c]MCT7995394.1 PAS domain S-box protein [Laspinema sp. D3c]
MIELSGYQIGQEIYRNTKRVVYRGIREMDGLPVILKALGTEYPSPTDIEQLHHEYEMTKDLNVGGIIEPLSLEMSRNLPVLVLPDNGEISLKTFLNQQGLEIDIFLNLGIQLAQILGEIHQHHIIHKDIKPSNIIIHPQILEVKLIDFAIASQLSKETAAAVHPNSLEGTLAYMSPEQTGRMNRAIDYRTDFYSLGVTFYEMLTGELPCQAEEAIEVVHCHIARMPIPPTEVVPEIPLAVSNLVMKLLAKTAENRYQSGYGLKWDLEYCLKQWQEQGKIDEFQLGVKDFSSKLEIPQKLYGRERERAEVLSAFERVCGGGTELILISGYSGVGKSALVQETQKPLVKHRGYFIGGKFDQFNVNIPYAAVIQALASLVRQLLSEPEAQIKAWKDKILAATGENAQVIIEVIPEVELIIGPQPALVSLPPTESQNRFNLVFQKFINIFPQEEHPLIFFIDDLQWADLASLELIKRVITDRENHYLLMIASYRDNEVTATHPVGLTLKDIKNTQVPVSEINLTPLNVHQVNDLLAETLNCTTAKSFSLAKLIFKKTQGNPFFLTQVLKSLEQDQLLKFNWEKGSWDWQSSQIEKIGMTENVVELMVSKIQKLQPKTQTALKLAACIGNSFDIEMLSIVNERSPHLTSRDLWEAIQEELIFPLAKTHTLYRVIEPRNGGKVCYQFLHDRVQQAAYSLIPENRKKETHWQIAYLLLKNTPPETIEESIFEIVNHLNYSYELITTSEQQIKLVRLNLRAGQKALAANAYELAHTYFQVGLRLLEEGSWESDYQTSLRLHIQAAYAAYLNTDFEQMEDLVKIGLIQAKSILDQVNFYEIRIKAYSSCSQQLKALENTQKALQLLNIHLPEQPTFAAIQVELNEISNQLTGKNIRDLIILPQMSEAHQKAGMRILNSAIAPAYQVAPMLLPLIVFQEIKLSLTYGNTDESAYAYACYGLILCGVVGNIETGHKFGQLALKVLDKFNNKELKCRTLMVVNNNVRVWKDPLKETLPPLLTAYETGLENGDLEYAGLSAYNYCLNSYFAGKELSKLEAEMASYNSLLEKFKQTTMLTYCQMSWQVVLNLRNKSDNSVNLVGTAYNAETMLPIHEQGSDRYALCCLYLHKLILSYLFRQPEQAVVNAALAANYLDALTAVYTLPLFYFYDSLSAVAVYLQASESEQEEILIKVETNQDKMKNWANFAPDNFQHKYELVEAEKARIKGEVLEAMKFYDQAIATAQKNNYIQEEALAWELAAEFYEQIGRDPIAGFYRQKAHSCYYRWGALAKVQDLEHRFSDLNSKTLEIGTNEIQTQNYTESKSSGYHIFLDLKTVIQASQALIGEVHLDQLLAKLMRLALENAGAQTGYLLLNQQGNFVIKAAGKIEQTEVSVRQAIAAETSSLLPRSLINYVSRTQEDVVLNDASQNEQFTSDPYILATQPKSVLCTPILGQGKLLGILYLENNLLVGAFSPSRVELLKLLSSQAAIALENAQLYQAQKEYARQLEKTVQERTHQLQQSNTRYYNLAANIPGMIYQFMMHPDGRFTSPYVSPVCRKIYGVEAEAAMEDISLLRALIHPDDRQQHTESITRSAATLEPWHSIWRIIVSGQIKWLQGDANPEKQPDGSILWDGLVVDITDRKQAEEELRQSEERWQLALQGNNDGIWDWNLKTSEAFISSRWKEILGYEDHELLNHSNTWISRIHPDDGIWVTQAIKEHFSGQTPYFATEHRLRCKNGTYKWILSRGQALWDVAGNPIRMVGSITDITDRKLAEEALAESERKYRDLVETSQEMIFSMNSQGYFTFVNQAVKNIYGYEPEEMIGHHFSEFKPSEYENKTQDQAAFDTILAGNSLSQYETIDIAKDGRPIYLLINAIIRQDAQGQRLGLTGTASNITQRKQAELALQQAKEAADTASKAKGEFLSKMSHELRTPLNAILGFTQILNRDNSLNPQQQDYLGIISRAGEHLLTLINDVLEMSKIEAGRISLNETSFDLYRLLTSLEEMFKLKAESQGLQLMFEWTSDVPQFIKTDESKLRQVFINLLGNAIKFTEKGGIVVRVNRENKSLLPKGSEGEAATYLTCQIEDTGPGISAEELESLFDPFVQTETGIKSQSGTGLGLPISRQFVQLMGGEITVSSTLDKGTIFKFNIKISLAEAMIQGSQVPRQRVIGLLSNQPAYRILVVEDKWESRLLLVNLLEPLGFEVREAVNGEDAVTMCHSWQPHLIWMDMQMPVMDGYEATRQIKRMTNGPIPVIIGLTASAFEENRAMVLEAGCDDFASKPFREDVIFQKMTEHLGVRYLYEEIAAASVNSHSASVPGDCLTVTECLQGMSPEWRTQLYQAASALDEEAITSLMTQIPDSHAALSTTLTSLVTQLRFDKIIELIQTND